MPAPRIAPLKAPYEEAVTAAFNAFLPPSMEPLKLFRTQAHNPRVLQRMFAANLLDKGSIDLRTRELIILRTCAGCGSEYEWGVHVALFAQRAGLSKTDIAATLAGAPDSLPPHEALLLQAVDALHDTSGIPDETWTGLTEHYTEAQLIELIALVGNYHTVSFITNAARIELEAFAPRFADYR